LSSFTEDTAHPLEVLLRAVLLVIVLELWACWSFPNQCMLTSVDQIIAETRPDFS